MAVRLKRGLKFSVLAVVVAVVVLAAEVLIARRRDYPFNGFDRIEFSVGSGQPLRIAMLGDSTVAGVGSPDVADSLPALTAMRVAAKLGRAVEVTGFGVSGARTDEVLAQAEALEEFDVVVVVIGSNNVTKLTPPWRFREQTRAMLEGLPKPVVFGGIPLFGGATAIPRPLRDVVRWYAGVLRNVQIDVAAQFDDVTFVNIAQQASPRFVGVPEAMSADGFHPAPVGYGFWADALATALATALAANLQER